MSPRQTGNLTTGPSLGSPVSGNSRAPDASISDALKAIGIEGLGPDSSPEAFEAVLNRLPALRDQLGSEVRWEAARHEVDGTLRRCGVRAPGRMIQAAVKESHDAQDSGLQGSALNLEDPEPLSGPVVPSEVLKEVEEAFIRHVALPEGASVALTLWGMLAATHDSWSVSPILAAVSPVKRCGKTTLLHLLSTLVPRPLTAANITSAALFPAVEKYKPTLILDEADTFLPEREELRGILNSGHVRASARILRSVGDDHDPRFFSTWAPKAIALIGKLPDSLEDRAIVVRMRRREQSELVEPLRLDRLDRYTLLRRKVWTFAQQSLDAFQEADPDVPNELNDRARDNWRPLLAIADLAGPEWSRRARAAALLLRSDDAEDALGVQLLGDVRAIFREQRECKLSSETLVKDLGELADRPWSEYRRDKAISQRQIATLLKPFGISPKSLWFDDKTLRGYTLVSLEEAFRRYLPQADPQVPQRGEF